MFDKLTESSISPNEYYVLCCIKDSVKPVLLTLSLELRLLMDGEWITETEELTPKALDLITELEVLFTTPRKKTSKKLMGQGFKDQIVLYRGIFPEGKLPTGKSARCSPGNLEIAFEWFFKQYKYSWDTILTATKMYVDDYQKKNYKFMRTSQYFIRKDNHSDLADLCDAIETNNFREQKVLHSVKVV